MLELHVLTGTCGHTVERLVTDGVGTGELDDADGEVCEGCPPDATGEQLNIAIANAASEPIRLPDNPARSMAVVGVADQGVHVA